MTSLGGSQKTATLQIDLGARQPSGLADSMWPLWCIQTNVLSHASTCVWLQCWSECLRNIKDEKAWARRKQLHDARQAAHSQNGK